LGGPPPPEGLFKTPSFWKGAPRAVDNLNPQKKKGRKMWANIKEFEKRGLYEGKKI